MNNLRHQLACNGCRQVNLSQVRSHLNRVNHSDYIEVTQCRRCKTDFVDSPTYNLHKHQNTCQNQAQRRQDIILPWARLYFAQYPNAERIPIPFCGEYGWLDDSYLARCRSMSPIAPSVPFLEVQQDPIDPGEPLSPLAPNPPINEPFREMENFFLEGLLAPPHLRSNSSEASDLRRLIPTLNTNDPTAAQNFQRALYNTSDHFFRLLANAPDIITDEQRHETAGMLEVIAGLLRTVQRPQAHQFQPPVSPIPMPPYPQVQVNPTTPVRPSLLNAANGHRDSVGRSTRTSSQGNTTASSQHRLSSYTDASSFDYNDPPAFDAMPSDGRGSSTRNAGRALSYIGNRASSATQSLRERFQQSFNHSTAQAPVNDPTLLQSPITIDDDDPDEFDEPFGPGTRDRRWL
ncbi:hypothetical protein IQ07DRAFT_276951 [Pyrenochaeta sp. DS3sAY3a]|nr:hypothetical protein IQ07DRAFT_276951 [Pyrenochaeta sp. DS3sAY3a]